MTKRVKKAASKAAEAVEAVVDPDLGLVFDGLFFLCFNTGGGLAANDPASECRVGFVTTAPPHRITISVKQKSASGVVTDLPGFPVELSHAAARRMQIDLSVPGVESPSVTRKGHHLTIDRPHPTEENKEYFKWIIDLENFEMHNTKLELIRGVLKPVMHINIGEFYTKELSRINNYFRTKVDAENTDYGAAAAVTGVRIAALPQDKAFLKVGASTYMLDTSAGTTYEVIFTNRCPQCDDEELGRLHLSDFPLHYHAFNVKVLDQYDFDFPDQAFPPAICYAASGSRTTDI